MSNSAKAYAEIVAKVDAIVALPGPRDTRAAAYMVARAALLQLKAHYGAQTAAEVAYRLADEFATLEPRR